MRRQRSRDTAPELALRRALHQRGMRYRVHYQPIREIRRTADIAFTGAKVAVFVDGCFWHQCPEHATKPKTSAEWWANKLASNAERDADTDRRLNEAGWTVIRVWEHEDSATAAERVAAALAKAGVIRRTPEHDS